MKLVPRQVRKPWGLHDLPSPFRNEGSEKVGEIWFEGAGSDALPFLTKYIFAGERLSVQVHPDDRQAEARGMPRGKTECWYVLDAQPGAVLGLGLTRTVDLDGLRSAAIDGSVMDLLDWKPVAPGDFFYVPAGTIHAIGAGVSLVEFQQNSDVTYRLFDYGRPRELHLDDATDVARPCPYDDRHCRRADARGDAVLYSGDDFTIVRAGSNADIPAELTGRRRWVMPLVGTAEIDRASGGVGDCLLLDAGDHLEIGDESLALVAAEGALH